MSSAGLRIAAGVLTILVLVGGVGLAVARRDNGSPTTSSRAIEVAIGSGPSSLPGTLQLPAGTGPWPVIVLVPGSGPQDRDETIGSRRPFRDLALGLARHGVATYRYEKRTKAHPGDFLGRAFTVDDEFVDDAVAGVRMLAERPEIEPRQIFVLGHSQGGTVAPRIAKAEPSIAGLVLLAASTEPLQQAIVRQTTLLNAIDGTVTPAEAATLEAVKQQAAAVESPTLSASTPSSAIFGIPASYWLDLRDYDPAAMAATIPRPMLVLRGDHDYQVIETSFDDLRRALGSRADVTFRLYPGLTHLFTEGPATPAAYEMDGHVSDTVIDDIASWIRRSTQPSSR